MRKMIMRNSEMEMKVRGRLVKFPVVDGLSPLEMGNLIGQVEEKMRRIEEKTDTPDTSKLAMLAAFEFAVELYNLRQKSESDHEAESRKIDDMAARLEKALAG